MSEIIHTHSSKIDPWPKYRPSLCSSLHAHLKTRPQFPGVANIFSTIVISPPRWSHKAHEPAARKLHLAAQSYYLPVLAGSSTINVKVLFSWEYGRLCFGLRVDELGEWKRKEVYPTCLVAKR